MALATRGSNITYDEKGNMKCIDDEYEMQFENKLEMMVDEDD